MMELAYKQYGQSGSPKLLILHGLFGMLDNWHMQAQRFANHFEVFTLDLRNHGRSPHCNEMDYTLMAQDVADFCSAHGLTNIHLLGHSMGGKTAMQFAVDHPQLLSSLLIADIAPKAYSPAHVKYFEAFRAIPFQDITSRKEADEAFAKYENNPAIRLFLLKNLEKAENGYRLKFNLEGIFNAYKTISGEVSIPYPIQIPTLFLKGALSNYINESDEWDISQQFVNAKFVTIPAAGHWLHAENPDAFFEACMAFLGE